jgi:DGQHR domain-containing protein
MVDKSIVLPVLRVCQSIGEFFVATISAKDLVEISFSDVRRLVSEQRDLEKYLGIQRPVNPKRIKDIKKYLEGSDATFPTSVIVSIDERCAECEMISENTGLLTLKSYEPDDESCEEHVSYGKIAKVIDGQHRIAAFMDEHNDYSLELEHRKFDFNLSIFIGADISEQANIFATVNLAQTKVNKSLVYDLTDLANTPSPHKTCHNVAVVIDGEKTSPLFQRIKRLGTATPGRVYEPLTQAGFVESLVKFISIDPVRDRNELLANKKLKKASSEELRKCPFRNLFIEGCDLDIAEIIFNYFEAIARTWPKSWNSPKESGNLLPRSNAFKAFMIFLKDDVYPKIVGDHFGSIPSVQDFLPYFQKVSVSDNDFTTRNFSPGSSGQSTFLKLLRGQVNLSEISDND